MNFFKYIKLIFKKEQSSPNDYIFLGRLLSDIDYYKKTGNRYRFYAGTLSNQIALIEKVYDELHPKPNWVTKKQIKNLIKEIQNS